MNAITVTSGAALALILAGTLASGTALAEKSGHANKGGKGGQHAQGQFGDQHRSAAHAYYDDQQRRGHCPPGLAKKNNGCTPPGLAKKWQVGHALPRDAVFHNLPASLSSRFGRPAAGQRYVRVDNDILLLQSSTGIVLDAILNFGKG
jgi:Ni/Co efflux regulator RcnB